MNIASAFIKQTLETGDFEAWSSVRKHYLPSEYHPLYTYIEKHCVSHHTLPTIEELKFGIRDAQTRAKLYAVESIEVDVEPSILLEYLKNEFTQREILGHLEKYVDESIAFETAEETIGHLHKIIIDVESRVDLQDPAESMERIALVDSDEDLSKYIALGLNAEFDSQFKFAPDEYIMIGGKRGAGKSVVCANLAVNVKNSGRAVLYFTIEMNARQIMQRCCSIDTGVPTGRLRTKTLSMTEWETVAKWWSDRKQNGDAHFASYLKHRSFDQLHADLIREPLNPNQIDIIYDPSLTTGKIEAEVNKKKAAGDDIGLIVVDYLNQVVRTPGKQYDWTEQIEVSKFLKSLAQTVYTTVVSPYQIDASGEARFAKGILDAADSAFIIIAGSDYITLDCTKMRSAEMKSFTSTVEWSYLKIGPATALTPKEKAALEESHGEDVNETISDDVPVMDRGEDPPWL